MAGIDLSVSGLASGFDWKSMVDQLTAVERQPQATIRTEQSNLAKRRDALGQISTKLSDLKAKSDALQNSALYKARTASSSDTSTLSITADSDSVTGSYSVSIQTLATSAVWKAANSGVVSPIYSVSNLTEVSAGLGPTLESAKWGATFTEGTFTIATKDNASGAIVSKSITASKTDTLGDLLKKICDATSASTPPGVTGIYDTTADKVTLTPPAGYSLVLGSANDTSNILSCLKLFSPTVNSSAATSSSTLGSLKLLSAIADQPTNTAVSPSTGSFTINGTSISYSTSNSLASILSSINDSAAGVQATYDANENRIVLRNKEPGNRAISVSDTSGNFLQAMGVLGGTLTSGSDLEYSINGGSPLMARSNTITAADSGLTGLTLTAMKTGTVSVTAAVDTASIQTAINSFVTSATNVQSLISSLTVSNRDAAGKITAGVLAYDQTVFQIGSSLRSLLMPQTNGPSNKIKSLEDLGFKTTGYSNDITVDNPSKLTAALNSNLSEVKAFFATTSTGMASKVTSFITPMVDEITGTLPTRQKNLTEQSAKLDDQIATMERRVLSNRDRMLANFRAMEAAQAKSNQQLQYLNQKLGLS